MALGERERWTGHSVAGAPHEVLAGIDLSGKTMLVTGANSGLGTETARALAAAGARVVIDAKPEVKQR